MAITAAIVACGSGDDAAPSDQGGAVLGHVAQEGVTVTLSGLDGSAAEQSTTADAGGAFEYRGLEPGAYLVTVKVMSPAGHTCVAGQPVQVVTGEEAYVDFRKVTFMRNVGRASLTPEGILLKC